MRSALIVCNISDRECLELVIKKVEFHKWALMAFLDYISQLENKHNSIRTLGGILHQSQGGMLKWLCALLLELLLFLRYNREMHEILLAVQLHSLCCMVLVSRNSVQMRMSPWHLPPDTGDAGSIQLRSSHVSLKHTQLLGEHWKRRISAVPLAHLSVPLFWQLVVLMPISVTR